MSAILFLIPVALVLGLAGLLAFLWALRSGQYEDLDGAAHRILLDDDLEEMAGKDHGKPDEIRPDDRDSPGGDGSQSRGSRG